MFEHAAARNAMQTHIDNARRRMFEHTSAT